MCFASPKSPQKTTLLRSWNFVNKEFFDERGKNAVNPVGFTSILTKSQWKILVSKSDSSFNALAKEVLKMIDKTMEFSLINEEELEIRKIILQVYEALKEKGYNPINQIVGYILSEDPTYITTHNNARNLIRRVDRDTLLQNLVKYYIAQ